MSGSELSVECELRNRKNQAAYLLADNRPTKSRRGFLPFRNLQIHLNKLAQQVKLENKDMEEVTGLGLLLQKLEYNALSSKARKVSDYGVPFKLINYYDSPELFDTKNFDKYERHIAEEIHRLFD